MRYIIEALFAIGIIPKFTVGISIGFSHGKSKGSSSSSSTANLDEQKTASEKKFGTEKASGIETSTQESSGTTKGSSSVTASGVETSTLSLLDNDTKNLISNLMTDLAAGDGGNQDLLSLLESRALGADAGFANLVDPQVAEARRLQEQELGQSVQSLSRATGGGAKSNSLVAGFDLEGQRAVDTSIASLAATLGIDARKSSTEEITGAFKAGLAGDQTQTTAVAALADVLKGASQTGTKDVASTEQTASLESVMQQLSGANTTEEVKAIVENLFSKERLTGTETSNSSGKSKEKSGSFGFGL